MRRLWLVLALVPGPLQAGLRDRLTKEYRANTYDAATGTIVVSARATSTTHRTSRSCTR